MTILPNGSPKVGADVYSGAEQADLIAGLYYVNIHNVNFPGGELTGIITQVVAAPSGSTWSTGALVLFLLGAAAVAIRHRRLDAQ